MRDISAFIDKLKQWAENQEHILASALVGSFAREAARDDSDVDVILITNDPQAYLEDDQWLSTFGRVQEVTTEDWGLVQSKRVFYDGNLEVEFGVTTRQWVETDPVDPGTRQVLMDGVRILTDSDGLLALMLDAINRDSS